MSSFFDLESKQFNPATKVVLPDLLTLMPLQLLDPVAKGQDHTSGVASSRSTSSPNFSRHCLALCRRTHCQRGACEARCTWRASRPRCSYPLRSKQTLLVPLGQGQRQQQVFASDRGAPRAISSQRLPDIIGIDVDALLAVQVKVKRHASVLSEWSTAVAAVWPCSMSNDATGRWVLTHRGVTPARYGFAKLGTVMQDHSLSYLPYFALPYFAWP
jgi:hypothetical protein